MTASHALLDPQLTGCGSGVAKRVAQLDSHHQLLARLLPVPKIYSYEM
jgi:hypothetical protein